MDVEITSYDFLKYFVKAWHFGKHILSHNNYTLSLLVQNRIKLILQSENVGSYIKDLNNTNKILYQVTYTKGLNLI